MFSRINGNWLALPSLLLIAAVTFSFSFVPLRSSQDEWWHLKTGEIIWENKELPATDPFTYTGQDMVWHNHEWLSQLILYGSYRAGEMLGIGGVRGLVGFKTLVVVTTMLLLAGLARMPFNARLRHQTSSVPLPRLSWPSIALLGVMAIEIGRRTIYPRPPIFSYLLMTVFLLILYAWKRGWLRMRWLLILPVLTVLWGNLHGMVLLAIACTGAFAGGEVLEWLSRRRRQADKRAFDSVSWKRILQLSGLTLAVLLAAMAQPSGYHLFFLGSKFMDDPLLAGIIAEMLPTVKPVTIIPGEGPVWDRIYFQPAGFWMFWIALGLFSVGLLFNRFRLSCGADYILLVFFTWQAWQHTRLLPLFSIAAMVPAAYLLWNFEQWLAPARRRILTATTGVVAIGLSIFLVFFLGEPPPQTFFRRNVQLVEGKVKSPSDYPDPLMDFIIKADLPPRMFSPSNYCGYFMWRLSPEHQKLFTDNRFDLFGSLFILDEHVINLGLQTGDRYRGAEITEGWQQLLEKYGIKFLVLRTPDAPHLITEMLRQGTHVPVYLHLPPGERNITRDGSVGGWSVWVDKDETAAIERALSIYRSERRTNMLPQDILRRAYF